MQRTVWDRKRVDVATNLESADWEGDDAPTNVALPAFAKATSGFWKGVVVGVGASALLAGVTSVGGAVIVVAVYGLPLPAGSEAAVARTVEPEVEAVREFVEAPVVAEPVVAVKPVAAAVPVVVNVEPPVVAKLEPRPAPAKVEPPVVAKVESRPAPAKVVERAKPESTPAPVVSAPVVKAIATPAPIALPAPEPLRPNRDELLQLALAAKQTRPAAPVATPAPKPAVPAPKWEEPEETADLTAADDKWMPVDDTEDTSSPTKSKSSGSDDDLFGK